MAHPHSELGITELDAQQLEMMIKEDVFVVDNDDNFVRYGSKKETHLMVNISTGLLHRAFSVLLFNSKGELLLQQRANEKITFPNYWTNTCCSHPIANMIPSEQNDEGHIGIKLAAIRKLHHELGIPKSTFVPEDFHFLTRIHYKSAFNETWGEHEIDYILIAQKDVELNINENEVRDVKYVGPSDIEGLLHQSDITLTPWFKLLATDKNLLANWWPKLATITEIPTDMTIHRY